MDINVHIDVEHTCTKDLIASLESPSGTVVEFMNLTSLVVCSSDLEGTILDDEALESIIDGRKPFSGRFMPTTALSGFDGEDAAGVWILTIQDDMPADYGNLTNFEIEFTLR